MRASTILVLLTIPIHAFAAPPSGRLSSPSLGFVENRGAWSAEAPFVSTSTHFRAAATRQGFVLTALAPSNGPESTTASAIEFRFPRVASAIQGTELEAARVSCFLRNDPNRFTTDSRTYRAVRWSGIAEGVDAILRANGTRVEWDLVVASGAGEVAIPIEVLGNEDLFVGAGSSLTVETSLGDWSQTPPQTFRSTDSTRVASTSRIRRLDPHHFEVLVERDAREAIVFDPVLAYSLLFGGSQDEPAYGGTAFDDSGNAYIVGRTLSPDFPVTTGALDTTANGLLDAFVAKIASDGAAIEWATLIGGTLDDDVFGVDLAPSGAVVVTGRTTSANFPTTPGAFDTSYNGYYDIVVFRLEGEGTRLRYSTFVGGVLEDYSYRLKLDPKGAAIVAGYSQSSDFPFVHGAYASKYGGGKQDGLVFRLAPDGKSLVAATFLGGEDGDYIYALALDGIGDVHVAGYTDSKRFPVTPHAFDRTANGSFDGFTSTLSSDLGTLKASTYVGGTTHDFMFGLDLASDGSSIVGGSSLSPDFPTTPGCFDAQWNGGYDDVIYRLSADATQLLASTRLGGSQDDAIADLVVDVDDHVMICGQTRSPDFPVTANAYSTVHGGAYDASIALMNASLTQLGHSTFLGGDGDDFASGLVLESTGRVFAVGESRSTQFPATSGFTPSFGGADAFVVRYVIPLCGAPSHVAPFGSGKGGAFGVPTLSAVASGNPFSVTLTNGRPNAPAILLFGKQSANLPYDGGTILVVAIQSVPLGFLDGTGSLTFEAPMLSTTTQCGGQVFEQVLILDDTAPGNLGVALTNALAFTLGD